MSNKIDELDLITVCADKNTLESKDPTHCEPKEKEDIDSRYEKETDLGGRDDSDKPSISSSNHAINSSKVSLTKSDSDAIKSAARIIAQSQGKDIRWRGELDVEKIRFGEW
ncbi:hypothetical protein A1D29_05995 [Pasteurellaceae bacterium Orientalotternb1]|nr:hypothetical protein A1D29_05995 [Pasteurellaceae bacterium Orientalotternb1]